MKGMPWRFLTAILFLLPTFYSKAATLDDLKKLESFALFLRTCRKDFG
jgi:hypothetical protein